MFVNIPHKDGTPRLLRFVGFDEDHPEYVVVSSGDDKGIHHVHHTKVIGYPDTCEVDLTPRGVRLRRLQRLIRKTMDYLDRRDSSVYLASKLNGDLMRVDAYRATTQRLFRRYKRFSMILCRELTCSL